RAAADGRPVQPTRLLPMLPAAVAAQVARESATPGSGFAPGNGHGNGHVPALTAGDGHGDHAGHGHG
ncbi:MAG TPA: hypothetical protein VIU37_05400, partial [Candidatus Limnocylindrales bacterium]